MKYIIKRYPTDKQETCIKNEMGICSPSSGIQECEPGKEEPEEY